MVRIFEQKISDKRLISLLREIVGSFSTAHPGVGLPLGNLTSQLFVNVYMNEFGQFIKHTLRTKHYIRYAGDFVILSPNRDWLKIILPEIDYFLQNRLKLRLHPDKLFIKTFASGVDFLGWVHFPDHRVLRSATKRRMIKRISGNPSRPVVASYRGMLSHGNAYKQTLNLP